VTSSRPSRAPVIVSLVVAIIAIALAIGAWFRPSPATPPSPHLTSSFSSEQVADAKAAVCSARDEAFKALAGAGGQSSDDPNRKFIIGVNTRLAIHANSDYLFRILSENPATESDLAKAINDTAVAYNKLLMAQLAGASDEDINPINAELDAANSRAVEACK
jgi:hypothetical protein